MCYGLLLDSKCKFLSFENVHQISFGYLRSQDIIHTPSHETFQKTQLLRVFFFIKNKRTRF